MHNEILKTGAKCWDSEFVFRQQVSDSFSNQYFSIWLLLDNLIIRIWDEMGILAFIQLVPLMSCDTSTEEVKLFTFRIDKLQSWGTSELMVLVARQWYGFISVYNHCSIWRHALSWENHNCISLSFFPMPRLDVQLPWSKIFVSLFLSNTECLSLTPSKNVVFIDNKSWGCNE